MKKNRVLLGLSSLLLLGIILALIGLFHMTKANREPLSAEAQTLEIVENTEQVEMPKKDENNLEKEQIEIEKQNNQEQENKETTEIETDAKEIEQEDSKAVSNEAKQTEDTNQVATKEEQQPSVLEGKIICIDAGHQKKGSSVQEPIAPGSKQTKARVSSGTRGVSTKKYEYELNLEVALKLQKALEDKGVTVYMVRETHDVDVSNSERAQLANEVGANLSLRIHADGSQDASVSGFSVLVPGGKYITEDIIVQSQSIGESLESALQEGIPNKSRGIVTRNDLTGFNWSKVPAVLIEMGFMSNPEEDERMSTNTFQDAIVIAIITGLENYYLENE